MNWQQLKKSAALSKLGLYLEDIGNELGENPKRVQSDIEKFIENNSLDLFDQKRKDQLCELLKKERLNRSINKFLRMKR